MKTTTNTRLIHETRSGSTLATRSGVRLVAYCLSLSVFFFLLMLLPLAGQAQNNWTNIGSGFWEAAGNWSSGLAPTNTDSIFITNGAYTVSVTNTSSAAWMTVSNLTVNSSGVGPNLLVNFADQAQTLTVGAANSYGTAIFGSTAGQNGSLTVSNGNFSALKVVLGSGAGSTGTWNIVGGTNTIRGSGMYALSVGDDGLGGITGARGSVLINGGVLNVTTPGGDIALGANSASTGILTVSNGALNASILHVGNFGTGNYNIFGGTNTITSQFDIGRVGGSTGAVLLAGGWLYVTNSANTYIGMKQYGVGAPVAMGTLTVSNEPPAI